MMVKLWFSTQRRNEHRRHLNQVPVGYFCGLICRIPCVGHGIFSSIMEQGFLLSCIKRVVIRGDCLHGGPSRHHSLLRLGRWSFLDHHDDMGFDWLVFDPDSGSHPPSSKGSEHHFCSLIIYGVDPAFLSVVTGSVDLRYYPLASPPEVGSAHSRSRTVVLPRFAKRLRKGRSPFEEIHRVVMRP